MATPPPSASAEMPLTNQWLYRGPNSRFYTDWWIVSGQCRCHWKINVIKYKNKTESNVEKSSSRMFEAYKKIVRAAEAAVLVRVYSKCKTYMQNLQANYKRFLNPPSAFHIDNRDRFLYQIRSLWNDSGIYWVRFERTTLIAPKKPMNRYAIHQ